MEDVHSKCLDLCSTHNMAIRHCRAAHGAFAHGQGQLRSLRFSIVKAGSPLHLSLSPSRISLTYCISLDAARIHLLQPASSTSPPSHKSPSRPTPLPHILPLQANIPQHAIHDTLLDPEARIYLLSQLLKVENCKRLGVVAIQLKCEGQKRARQGGGCAREGVPKSLLLLMKSNKKVSFARRQSTPRNRTLWPNACAATTRGRRRSSYTSKARPTVEGAPPASARQMASVAPSSTA